MINILHISANKYNSINPKDHTFKIWNELAKRADKYYVFARSVNNRFEKYEYENITLILIPKIINPARIFILTSFLSLFYLKKYKITHIVCQSVIFGGLASLIAKKLFKIPVMIEIHGEEYFRIINSGNILIKLLGKALIAMYKNATKVRSLNPFMTSKLKALGIVSNVVEIQNRVDLSLFNEIKEDFSIDGKLKIVSIGRFVKEKNYLSLIAWLCESDLDFHLTLIGGGPLKQEYISLIESIGKQDRITLIDWIEQKDFIKIMTKSDVYIQSSVSEGMPRTIVEAMALQMPVISTKVGSIEGVIENEINGILVPVTSDGIIHAITELLKSEQLRKRLALKARKDVIDKYEWNMVFTKYRNEIISMR